MLKQHLILGFARLCGFSELGIGCEEQGGNEGRRTGALVGDMDWVSEG